MAFPTLTPNFSSGASGTRSWTLAQGGAQGLIIAYQKAHNTVPATNDQWGGLASVRAQTYGGDIQQSHYCELSYLTDLTGKASDTREAFGNAYATEWCDILSAEAIEFVGSDEDERVNGAYGTLSTSIDCGADDATIVAYVITDHPSDWAVNPIANDAGASRIIDDVRFWSKGYGRIISLNIPGGTGVVTLTCGSHGGDAHMAAAAFKVVGATKKGRGCIFLGVGF